VQVTVTKHARERWVERVNPELKRADETDKAVLAALSEAVHIYAEEQERDGERKLVEFYLWRNVVLVVGDAKVLTVYPAEYGLGEEIDRKVCEELKAKVLGLQKRLADERARSEKTKAGICHEIDQLTGEIKKLQRQIETLEARVRVFEHQKDEVDRQVAALEQELEFYARKLVYSVIYRLEWASQRLAAFR
jgi:predicted RNase H-like nuclease (RuvC/YqgF family)